MFILFNYPVNIYTPTPDIRIYCCFNNLDKCIDHPKYHDRPNVLF